jgi:O-antigen/teichoic acid export membrane protein
LLAIGKVKAQTIVFGILTLFEILFAIFLSSYFGIIGIAYAFLLHGIALFTAYYMIGYVNGMRLSLTRPYLGEVATALIAYISALFLNSLLSSNIMLFVLKLVLVTICYILFSFVLVKSETKELIGLFIASKGKKYD